MYIYKPSYFWGYVVYSLKRFLLYSSHYLITLSNFTTHMNMTNANFRVLFVNFFKEKKNLLREKLKIIK